MFIGHFAVGLAAKKATPKVSLGTLFIAAQFLDLIWPIFLLLGIETVKIVPGTTAFLRLDLHDYPFSHATRKHGNKNHDRTWRNRVLDTRRSGL
jgi:hypothetical protein